MHKYDLIHRANMYNYLVVHLLEEHHQSPLIFFSSPSGLDKGFSPLLFTLISMQSFVNYVLGFYGRHGIYAMGATRTMVCDTINKYLDYSNQVWIGTDISFCYDTYDRELIRDMLIKDYGLVFPH